MTFRRLALMIGMALVSVPLMASAAGATTVTNIVTIHDGADDQMFVTHDQGSDPLGVFCSQSEDYCYTQFYRSDSYVVSATGPSGEPMAQNDCHTTRVDEPGGGQSDRLFTCVQGYYVEQYLFSDMPGTEGGSSDYCYYGCGHHELTPIVETGNSQLASTTTWSDGRIDQFFFQSEVPEPASLLLMGTGLLAGARRWRKRKTNA